MKVSMIRTKIVPDPHYSNWYTLYVWTGWWRGWRKAGWHHGMGAVDSAIANLHRCY